MRDTTDDSKDGPTKNQLRSLTFQNNQPAFLRNALSALQGPQAPKPAFDEHGRPAIPERPDVEGGEKEEEAEESEEDEWDLGRGEEAPAVVVLKEGRHLERTEVDRLRAEAKASSVLDPLASSSAPAGKTKLAGSLKISNEDGTNSKPATLAEGETSAKETWEDVVRRSKLEAEEKKLAKIAKEEKDKKEKEAAEKAKKKDKKMRSKAVSRLSFADED